MTVVSDASLTGPVSPGSEISILGSGLASASTMATSGAVPTTFSLLGTSVMISYSNNTQDVLPLYTVSPTQIAAAISANVAVTPVPGLAMLTVVTPTGTQTSPVEIAPYAPALFAANQNGKGAAMAMFMQGSTGVDAPVSTYQCTAATAATMPCVPACPTATPCVPVPLNLSEGGMLILNATGLANAPSVTVTVRGMEPVTVTPMPQTNMPGMYKLSVPLPAPDPAVRGVVPIVLTVPGASVISNVVTISIQ
jgi:uncharacterized protein (TIGR03437 family)